MLIDCFIFVISVFYSYLTIVTLEVDFSIFYLIPNWMNILVTYRFRYLIVTAIMVVRSILNSKNESKVQRMALNSGTIFSLLPHTQLRMG